MKQILTIITVSIASQFISAQKNIGAFTSLKVFDKIPVELILSDTYKVEISGKNQNNIELVSTNNELKVRMITTKTLQGSDTKVTLYYKDINSIQASQGSKITALQPIETEKLSLVSNEGSSINLTINTTDLEAKSNTGGIIKLEGNTVSQDILTSTGGHYKSQNLQSKIATVTANAGGEAEVNVTTTITAKTRAGGKISIYGNPETRNEKKVIGGTITYK